MPESTSTTTTTTIDAAISVVVVVVVVIVGSTAMQHKGMEQVYGNGIHHILTSLRLFDIDALRFFPWMRVCVILVSFSTDVREEFSDCVRPRSAGNSIIHSRAIVDI